MSELQLIQTAVQRAARRRWLERIWRGFWQGLLAGGLVWLLIYGVYKLVPLPAWWLVIAALLGGVLLLAGLALGAGRKTSLLETARWVDDRKHLQERLSTALELAAGNSAEEWKKLVLGDAARHAKDLDARRLVPLRFPVAGRWALLVLVLGAGLGLVPEYRSQKHIQQQQDTANIRDTGKQLAGFTRQNLQQRPPILVPTQKALDKVVEAGEKLSKATLTRSEALRELASVTEKLSQQAKELGQTPALKPLERAARDPSGGGGEQTPEGLQKQTQALQEKLGKSADQPAALDKAQDRLQQAQQALANLGDTDSPAAKAARAQLAQSLAELSQQMRDLGVSLPDLEEAIKALEKNQTGLVAKDLQNALTDLDKLRSMAKALQQLQQQSAKLGKDLGEQLERGQTQAAQQNLQKMIQQLNSGNLSQKQLQKIQQEVAKAINPGNEYGKLGELLQKAAQQMQQGNKPGAAQSLAEAAKELEKLSQQMADLNSLLDALSAMERAEMAIASGKKWGECQGKPCSACNGMGCSKCRGWGHGGGANPGGVGTWADESGWMSIPDTQTPVDNSGIARPDMDSRGLTDRDALINPNMAPTKVRGQISQGGPMPSITLKGVNIKGKSTVAYEEAATAAQSDAQSALNQDKVPRAYQETVRDYFDDLKK